MYLQMGQAFMVDPIRAKEQHCLTLAVSKRRICASLPGLQTLRPTSSEMHSDAMCRLASATLPPSPHASSRPLPLVPSSWIVTSNASTEDNGARFGGRIYISLKRGVDVHLQVQKLLYLSEKHSYITSHRDNESRAQSRLFLLAAFEGC